MYLSRIALDTTRRTTMMALSAPQEIHGAIESAFAGERSRRLWRLDSLGGRQYLLILSEEKADLTSVARQFSAKDSRPETKLYDPLLQRIEEGSVWQFRLTANPTKSVLENKGSAVRGSVKACGVVAEQEQWLRDRAEKHGFSVREGAFRVTASQWFRFAKGGTGPKVSLLSVTYEGMLQVTDAELFRETLTKGMGRGKAYGMGLLTVMRPPMSHA